MKIQRATLGDIPFLTPLIVAAHKAFRMPTPYARTLKEMPQAMLSPNTIVLVALDEQAVLGYAWLQVLETGEMFIHQVYGKGRIGKDLYAAIEQEALDAGCIGISGLTYRDPAPFIRKYGFRVSSHYLVKELSHAR